MKSFIDQSPDGFDTRIENNGANLSLGVRRRLALARALATDGMLVIIDDPTEGLDAEGIQVVSDSLNALSQRGRTIIVFSHDATILPSAPYYMDLNSKPVPKMVKREADATASTPLAAVPGPSAEQETPSAKKAGS